MRKGTVMVRDAGERTDLRGEEGGRGRAGSVRERDWVGCCLGWDRECPELEASLNSVPVLDQLEETYWCDTRVRSRERGQ